MQYKQMKNTRRKRNKARLCVNTNGFDLKEKNMEQQRRFDCYSCCPLCRLDETIRTGIIGEFYEMSG